MTTPKLQLLLQELQKDLDEVDCVVHYAQEYLDGYREQKRKIEETLEKINKLFESEKSATIKKNSVCLGKDIRINDWLGKQPDDGEMEVK